MGALCKEFTGDNLHEIATLLADTGVVITPEASGRVLLNNTCMFKGDRIEITHGSVLLIKPPYLGSGEILL